MRLRHIALLVPDLMSAEEHYAALFGLRVLFRQAERDGTWTTLGPESGSEASMVALQRDELVISLFSGAPAGEQLHAIGLFAENAEIEAVVARLPADARVEAHRPDWLVLVDRFGVRWQLSPHPYGDGSGACSG